MVLFCAEAFIAELDRLYFKAKLKCADGACFQEVYEPCAHAPIIFLRSFMSADMIL